MSDENNECVRVVVRARPFSKKEISDGRKMVVACDAVSVNLRSPDTDNDVKGFTFDTVYDENSTQRAVYDETAYPLVESVLKGYNGTIFAYGQTGCGKTHTMQGLPTPPELRGIIPNSFDHIFDHIQVATKTEKVQFLVRCSYLEIYNEEIRDLLSPQKALRPGDDPEKLELHENPDQGVYVKDLTMTTVDSVATIDKVMMTGNKFRTTGATAMNETSSRSHSIFTIVIDMTRIREDGKEHVTRGKLNLVDLAGSERASKTGATGSRMKEGIKINLSLTALGNVISALVENANAGGGKQRHVPYRDSKLTRLLQDSLGGNTKTVMVAAIGPADYNYEETLSTLRYANRAKNIKNKPKLNEDPKDALLRQYKGEIERLKALLLHHLTAAGTHPDIIASVMASVGGGPATTPGSAATGATPPAASAATGAGAVKKPAPAAPTKPTQATPTSEPTLAAAPTPAAAAAAAAASDTARSSSKGGSSGSRSSSVEPQHKGTSGGGSGGVPSVTGNTLAASIAASQPPLTIRGAPSSSSSSSSSSSDGGSTGMGTPSPSAATATATATATGNAGQSGAPASTPASAALLDAERELEKERSGREDMMKKMLALQDLVLGSGRGGGGGGGGKAGAAGGGAPRSRTNSAGGGMGVASVGEFDDPELRAAREREETRRARAAELRRSRDSIMAKRLAASSAAGDSSGGEWDDDDEEEEGEGGAGAGGSGKLLLPLPSSLKGGKFRGGFTGTVCAVCRGRGEGGGGGGGGGPDGHFLSQPSPFLSTLGGSTSAAPHPSQPSAYLQYPVGGKPRPSTPPKQMPLSSGAPLPPPPTEVQQHQQQQQQQQQVAVEIPMSVEALPPPFPPSQPPQQPQQQPLLVGEDLAEEKQREDDEADEKVRWEGRESKEGDKEEEESGCPPGSPLPPFSPPPAPLALPDMSQYMSKEEVRAEMVRLQARVKRKYEKRYGGALEMLRSEIAEEREEMGNERERTSGELREVNKLASLLEAVVGLFLPEREKDKALDRAVWDETRERWLLPRVKPRPGYAVRSKVGAIAGIGPQGVGLKMAVRNPLTGMTTASGGGGRGGANPPSAAASASASSSSYYASSTTSGVPSDPEDGGGGEYHYGGEGYHQQQQQQDEWEDGDDGEEGGGMVLAPGEELVMEDIAHLRASTVTALPTLPMAAAAAGFGGGGQGRLEPSSNLLGLTANTALPSLHKGGGVKGGGGGGGGQQQPPPPSAFPPLPSLTSSSSGGGAGPGSGGRGNQQQQQQQPQMGLNTAPSNNTSFPSLLPASSTPGAGRGASSSSSSSASAGAGMFPSLQGGGKGVPTSSKGVAVGGGGGGGAPANAGLPSLFPPLGVDKQVDKAMEGWLGGGQKGSARGGTAPSSTTTFPKL